MRALLQDFIWSKCLRVKIYPRNDSNRRNYEKISSVSVNQHNYTDSRKNELILTSSRLCKFPSNVSLFIISPKCFTTSSSILYFLFSFPSSYSNTNYHLPQFSLFFYLLPSQLYSTVSPVYNYICEESLSQHLTFFLQKPLNLLSVQNCAVSKLFCTVVLTYLFVILFYGVCCLFLAEFTVSRVLKQKRHNYFLFWVYKANRILELLDSRLYVRYKTTHILQDVLSVSLYTLLYFCQ